METATAGATKPEARSDGFVGRVLARASPILTWRPAKVQRITPTPRETDRVVRKKTDSLIHRVSRMPTRRMVAWPVIRRVERAREGAMRVLFARIAVGVLMASLIAAAGYAGFAVWTGGGSLRPLPTRLAADHLLVVGVDTLALAAPATSGAARTATLAATQPQSAEVHRKAHPGHRRLATASNR